jgi:hypothetical protein
VLQHPNELVLARKTDSGKVIPSPAMFRILNAGVQTHAHAAVLSAQANRQVAFLEAEQ